MISMFSDLLSMVKKQPEHQHFLFLFASAKTTKKRRKQDDKKDII
ncbi:MAG: hypothetical protein ACI9UT_000910 [Flavobacteriales bacterium]|jgi:hypothetical protein